MSGYTRPLTADEQAQAVAAIAAAPKDLWLRTRTPINQPYPCLCSTTRACSPRYCPCAGRVDLDDVPRRCCAHTNTPAVVAAFGSHLRVLPGGKP